MLAYDRGKTPQRVVEWTDNESNSFGLLVDFRRECEKVEVERGFFRFRPFVNVLVGKNSLGNYGPNVDSVPVDLQIELVVARSNGAHTHRYDSSKGRPRSLRRVTSNCLTLSLNMYASCKSCSLRYATDFALPA